MRYANHGRGAVGFAVTVGTDEHEAMTIVVLEFGVQFHPKFLTAIRGPCFFEFLVHRLRLRG